MCFSQKLKLKYQKYKICIDEYKIINPINSGTFGSVYLVQNTKTKEICAAKVLSLNRIESNCELMINREISIMIRCEHPTIIKFHGYSLKDFHGENNTTIFMDFSKRGSLAELLKKSQNGLADHDYDNTARQKILIGIARGMMYLHEHQIIHRDLKPGNILLDEKLEPHITDFGLSKIYEIGQTFGQSQWCGTTIYMAPEVISSEQYSQKADVYSFGILMFEVVTDSIPYPDLVKRKMTTFQFNEKVVHQNYRPKFLFPIKKSIQNLIERCWDKETKNRPTFEELFNLLSTSKHEFLFDIFNDNFYCKNEQDDIDDDDKDGFKYYLNDVDDNEVQLYVDDITNDQQNHPINNMNVHEANKVTDDLKKQIESIKNENIKIKAENDKMKMQNSIIQSENEAFKNKNESLTNQIARIQNEKDEFKTENSNLKELILRTQNENKEIKTKNEILINQITRIQNENNELKEENSNLKKQITIIQNGNKDVKTENSNSKKSASCIQKDDSCNQASNFQKLKDDDISISQIVEQNDVENHSVELFNDLSLKMQHSIINSIMNQTSFVLRLFSSSPLSKYDKLINYLIQLTSMTDNCIKVLCPNTKISLEEMNKSPYLNNIHIQSKMAEILFTEKSFNNKTFIEIIRQFKEISIGIKYPSNFFKQYKDVIMNLQKSQNPIIHIIFYINEPDFNIDNTLNITNVYIGSSIKSIKKSAFCKCTSLKQVLFENPSSVTEFCESSFKGCSSLTQFLIPSSVTKIGDYAFKECSSLTEISIPSSVTEIGISTFSGCSLLTEISIPSSLTEIGLGFFDKCTSLKRIEIPSSVKKIGGYAFNECSSLIQISIPSSVTSIGTNVFNECSSLEKVSILSPITSITMHAFSGCTSLKQVSIPSSVIEINEYAFEKCSSLTEIEIPSSVNKIGDCAFKDCSSFKQFQIPFTLSKIGNSSFEGCSSLKRFQIPSFVTSIGSCAFRGCSSLIEISIPTSITKIENSSFEGCSSLKQLEISAFVTSIGDDAFCRCSSLSKISIPSSVTKIGQNSFSRCSSLTQISISSSVSLIGCFAFSECSSLTQIEIPYSVTFIEIFLFFKCSSLKQISIPSSVTNIGINAFNGCSSLTQVFFKTPSSVTSIGDNAFYECSSLTQITIPSSITSIGESAFYGCSSHTAYITYLINIIMY